MRPAIETLRKRFHVLAQKVGAPNRLACFHRTPTDSGAAHIEIEGDEYCYVVTERGTEFERRRTKDPDTLLYWLLRSLTFEMASDYELKHRKRGEDSRRQLFAKQLELLGRLKEEWRSSLDAELQSVLQNHPYTDEKTG